MYSPDKGPYLKCPVWLVTVDGQVQGEGELHYPVLSEFKKSQPHAMDYCSCLQNVIAGGAVLEVDDKPTQKKRDDQKMASQLATEAAVITTQPALPLMLDVACLSLYAATVPPTMQAILAEASIVMVPS